MRGITIIASSIKVVLICILALSILPFAIDAARLFLSPLPKPISNVSIHTRMLLMVSHIPYSY